MVRASSAPLRGTGARAWAAIAWITAIGGCADPCAIEGPPLEESHVEVLAGTFGAVDESTPIRACSTTLDGGRISLYLNVTFARPDDGCGPERMAVGIDTTIDRGALVRDEEPAACILPASSARLAVTLSPPSWEVPGFLVGPGTVEIHEAVYSGDGNDASLRGELHFDLADEWHPPFDATCPWWLTLRFDAPPCPPDDGV
jgi:hypothetical protein